MQADKGYEQLRSDAIRLYENSANIRDLLSDYGGWNKNSLLTQLPETLSYDDDDIAFWIVILLYSELKSGLHQFGLGSNQKLMQGALIQLGWIDRDRELLIRGRSFRDFAKGRFLAKTTIPDYWNYVRPSSTASWAG